MFGYIGIGVVVAVAIFIATSKSLSKKLRIALATILIVASASFVLFTQQTFMGPESAWKSDSVQLMLLYLVMLFGMLASILIAAISERRNRIANLENEEDKKNVKLNLDRYDLLYPFLLSFLTFGALYQQIIDQAFGIVAMTLAFQTGFFWEVVLKSVKATASSG